MRQLVKGKEAGVPAAHSVLCIDIRLQVQHLDVRLQMAERSHIV